MSFFFSSDPKSQSFSQGYGSDLPTSLTHIILVTRGCSAWRPAGVISKASKGIYPEKERKEKKEKEKRKKKDKKDWKKNKESFLCYFFFSCLFVLFFFFNFLFVFLF